MWNDHRPTGNDCCGRAGGKHRRCRIRWTKMIAVFRCVGRGGVGRVPRHCRFRRGIEPAAERRAGRTPRGAVRPRQARQPLVLPPADGIRRGRRQTGCRMSESFHHVRRAAAHGRFRDDVHHGGRGGGDGAGLPRRVVHRPNHRGLWPIQIRRDRSIEPVRPRPCRRRPRNSCHDRWHHARGIPRDRRRGRHHGRHHDQRLRGHCRLNHGRDPAAVLYGQWTTRHGAHPHGDPWFPDLGRRGGPGGAGRVDGLHHRLRPRCVAERRNPPAVRRQTHRSPAAHGGAR